MYRGKKQRKTHGNLIHLEWTTPVEHIHGNWPGKIPEVHRWAYDYSKVDDNGDYIHGEDFVLQTAPLKDGEEPS